MKVTKVCYKDNKSPEDGIQIILEESFVSDSKSRVYPITYNIQRKVGVMNELLEKCFRE